MAGIKGIGTPSQPQLRPVETDAPPPPSASAPPPATGAPARGAGDDFEPSTPRGVALRHGEGAHAEGKGLNGTSGVLHSSSGRISADAWSHPEQIVGHLTQNPAHGSTANSGYRCGPSSLLGAALMQGQGSAARFIDNAANGAAAGRLSDAEKTELHGIANDIRSGRATFEQLNRAQGLLYEAGNSHGDVDQLLSNAVGRAHGAERTELQGLLTRLRNGNWLDSDAARAATLVQHATGQSVNIHLMDDPQRPGNAAAQYYTFDVDGARRNSERSGFDDDELNGLARLGGATTRTQQLDSSVRLQDMFTRLQPGETLTVRVGGTDDTNVSDHFVSIGRRSDGTAFIYNPDPDHGDYTLFTGSRTDPQPANFTAQLEHYNNRLLLDNDGDMPRATISRFPN